jgi:hypothetical protein
MIEWGAFLVVAVAALAGACGLVVFAAVGIRLFEAGERRREAGGGSWRPYRAGAVAAFVVCAATVLFGVYLIIPALH